ncbi:MAG TPA: F0F1 ATP synthase subunit B [Gemmatimonadales bacterium]|jgi:F-type H+-transporting ATPase subunit b|nr:F0F1 ATP synthase subunit B [Gemmatimonadales bacterium]
MAFAVFMLLQEAAVVDHAAEAGPASPFEVNFGLFFWTLVVFGILLLALWKYGWPEILKMTEERERKIQTQLAEAERLNTEAKAAIAQGQKLQLDARHQAQALLAEARSAVEKEKASLVDRVRLEQEALLERTRREIAAERDKALLELRREAVDLSLGAAAKLIGARLDAETDRKIVLDYLAKVETAH